MKFKLTANNLDFGNALKCLAMFEPYHAIIVNDLDSIGYYIEQSGKLNCYDIEEKKNNLKIEIYSGNINSNEWNLYTKIEEVEQIIETDLIIKD